jgi:hypothetical protein
MALTSKEADAIRQYVKAGGVVLADARTALMDEHCRTLKAALLDDVFGVTRPRVDPSAASHTAEIRFTRDLEACRLSGLNLDVSLAEPDLKATDGVPLSQHERTPVVVVRRHGKGAAVLLNFCLESYPRRRELHQEKPLLQLVENLLLVAGMRPEIRVEWSRATAGMPPPRFFIVRYRSGQAHYVAVQYDTATEKQAETVPVSVTLPPSGCAYDVRSGEMLGRKTHVDTSLAPGDTRLYALLPYQVSGVSIQCEKTPVIPGSTVGYRVDVGCAGPRGTHVFAVEVLGPDGKPRTHYGRKLVGQKGSASGEIPLALNDTAGVWTLRATDIATRKSGECRFTINSR